MKHYFFIYNNLKIKIYSIIYIMSSKENVKPKAKARTPYRQYKKAPVKRAPVRRSYSSGYGTGMTVYKPNIPRSMTYAQACKYYDAFDKGTTPIYSENSLGNFNCLSNISSLDITVSNTPEIVVFNPSVRGVYTVFAWSSTGVFDVTSPAASPTYRYGTSDTTPLAVRNMRASYKILNTTKHNDISGTVDVIQLATNIEWEFVDAVSRRLTQANIDELLALKNNQKCKTYTASDLQHDSTGVVFPASFSSYNGYGNRAFDGSTLVADFQSSLTQASGDMSMNLVVMIFNPVATANTYTIKFCSQNAFRFPSSSLLNEMTINSKQPPNKDFHEKLNAAINSVNGNHQIIRKGLTQGEPGVYYG